MLREFDLQRMHWADKTQSMLHQRQMEACETRLLSYPTESIFTLQDERETECWWQCSYDAEESPKSPALHTLREMRANVLAAPARGSRAADRDGTCADCPADSLRRSGAHRRLAGAVRR